LAFFIEDGRGGGGSRETEGGCGRGWRLRVIVVGGWRVLLAGRFRLSVFSLSLDIMEIIIEDNLENGLG
jgi:hypothetical protein